MSALIACHGCDLLVDVEDLADGSKAICPRCGHFLTRRQSDANLHVISYALAALIFMAAANAFPFLSFSASGLESVMTLRATPGSLLKYGMPELAFMVAAFIILIPTVLLLLVLSICIPLHMGYPAPWLRDAGRLVFTFQNWAMVEVFIIGVIVSLVKIAAMATIELGISFWAYAAFSICFTAAFATLDRFQCWQEIEEVGAA